MVMHLTFTQLIEKLLHYEVDMKQSAVISHIVAEQGIDVMKKWADHDPETLAFDNKEFRADLLDVMVKTARQMKLKYMNRERIDQCLDEIHQDAMRVNEEYKNEA